MILSHARLALVISAALIAPPTFATAVHRSPTGSTSSSSHKLTQHRRHNTVRRARGQQAIEPERVTQIQQALIREHYLTSEANGKWDSTTQAAMQKYQADNGWQTKLMPDSRAIKKLGLGPDYSTAINAKEGNFAPPPPAASIPPAQATGFAEASGVHQ
ncbi:MAG: peptidoglycan-binding domain-containing protein [Terracidiphilus sp.]|jgi:peptidoglycan hydrolase-like protein with peptidoglycan-binding domain